ncbi:hypothetical protein [Methanimicrococcus blatticola]|uniref:Uncharacterized protein n=1 Tax=Methanimicrococcus blatticola TaxID=91560 RepID=A0A484F6Z4_9EURY|nr:hypothetical protein [Methanimicrococcus blatticola]MBZ3935161.1 hypothetical protein [Methanimicrococcus blatticola]MCC2508742.1 hypothetical protein [Methanimicrococcus blatticola]TDQ71223.1 hypothetical protein C7391_0328 [Methanimicrococcus blatticola]
MSSEIGSEFSGIIKINGEKYRQKYHQTYRQTCLLGVSEVCDRGISFMYTRPNQDGQVSEDLETIREFRPSVLTNEPDELIQFHKDPDYEEENELEEFSGYDSLLPYDYETDFVDTLNLDEQIAMYAADSWEFVAITDNIILFQRPKWEA